MYDHLIIQEALKLKSLYPPTVWSIFKLSIDQITNNISNGTMFVNVLGNIVNISNRKTNSKLLIEVDHTLKKSSQLFLEKIVSDIDQTFKILYLLTCLR